MSASAVQSERTHFATVLILRNMHAWSVSRRLHLYVLNTSIEFNVASSNSDLES